MPRPAVFWTIACLAAGAAVAQAWWLRWSCDDAYITFRYAQHFVQGHGLVFNRDPAEAPVEGYSNFLWTLWCALGMALGFTQDRIELWSNFWGTAAHGATVVLLAGVGWRASRGRATVPLAACGYAALHHAASLAPAGLETAWFVWLVLWLCRCCLEPRCPRKAGSAGCVAALAAMTRPDGALVAASAGLCFLVDALRTRKVGAVAAYTAPLVLLFGSYLLWRHDYYGFWLPNTFYAKSAGEPYPGQGLRYVVEFLRCYWVLVPVLVLPWLWSVRAPDPLAPLSPYLGRRPWLVLLAFTVPYLLFVLWVGGDFMFGRFLVPIAPLWLLALDFACLRWRWHGLPWLLGPGLVLGMLLRHEPPWLGDYLHNPYGFTDNRAISVAPLTPELTRIDGSRMAGQYLRWLCAGLDVRLAIMGSHANLAYRSEVPVAIECSTGLTDVRLAHQELSRRGRIGHEKGYRSALHYLTHERGVQISFDLDYRSGDLTDAWRDLQFPVIPARLLRWDGALLAALRARDPNIACADVPARIDEYLAGIQNRDREQVRTDYAALCRFYFDHNDDPARRAAFEAVLK